MLGTSGYPSMYGGAAASFPAQDVTPRPPGWWALGLTRITIGILWWSQLLWKAPKLFGTRDGTCSPNLSFTHLGGLCDRLHREALHPLTPTFFFFGHNWTPTITFYANFVKNTVIPHFTFFGWAYFVIETFITVSLFFGLFTKLGSLVGLIWALNLAIGLWSVPGEWYWTYLMLAALHLIFFATLAGRYFGLDAILTRGDSGISNFFRLLG